MRPSIEGEIILVEREKKDCAKKSNLGAHILRRLAKCSPDQMALKQQGKKDLAYLSGSLVDFNYVCFTYVRGRLS